MELLILFLLILLNGVFAMSEMAVVSARQARLKPLADQGDQSAKAALDLTESPSRFLSTVQIGITLIGLFAGAFGGATLASDLAVTLRTQFPSLTFRVSNSLALVLILLMTTYLSLVFGEIAPKRIALYYPERIARLVARPMRWLSVLAAPIVYLLSVSTVIITRPFGVSAKREARVTEGEVLSLVRQGIAAGTFDKEEGELVRSVMRLDAIRIRSIMTPRTDLAAIDIAAEQEKIHETLLRRPHTIYPIIKGDVDGVIGVVHTRDLMRQYLNLKRFEVRAILRPLLLVPESTSIADTIRQMRQSGLNTAFVIDEYGGIEGLIRSHDILVAILGELDPTVNDTGPSYRTLIPQPEGQWIVEGNSRIVEIEQLLEDFHIPQNERSEYETIAGFLLTRFGHIPEAGEFTDWEKYRFRVSEREGMRIQKIKITLRDDRSIVERTSPTSNDPLQQIFTD